MDNNRLNPCPFCGGEATIKKIQINQGMDGSCDDWLIQCKSCNANMTLPADGFYGRIFLTKEEAIARWNRRTHG